MVCIIVKYFMKPQMDAALPTTAFADLTLKFVIKLPFQ